MTLAAVIPIRSLTSGKARLAGLLDTAERAALNRALFDHALEVATSVPGASASFVLTPDPEARALARAAGFHTPADPGAGLNAALSAGLDAARAAGAVRIVVMAIDLPCVGPSVVRALAEEAEPVVIAPDRHGAGTNMLCVEATLAFTPRFGADSLGAHIAEARRLGVRAAVVNEPRAALDIDTEDDWRAWGGWEKLPKRR